MEVTDLAYLMLLEGLRKENITNVTLIYGYNTKMIGIGKDDNIEIYSRGQNMDWFDIGANHWKIVEDFSIDIKCKTREKYYQLREFVKKLFTGQNQVFGFSYGEELKKTYNYNVDYTEVEWIGIYSLGIRLVHPEDFDLQKGDYVEVITPEKEKVNGWIWGLIDDWLYIILRRSAAILIRPKRLNEESMKVRRMFHAIFDLQGEIIEPVQEDVIQTTGEMVVGPTGNDSSEVAQ